MAKTARELVRCHWATNPLNIPYHDEEWGVPVQDEFVWFEFLILEGAQAGLSWDTILKKRQRYRQLFSGFNPERVARFDAPKVKQLLRDPGIIRNRLKIHSAVSNAKAFLKVQDEFSGFGPYAWKFVGGAPIHNKWKSHRQVPAVTPLATAFSKDLQKRGFRFVGPTIIYAFMQATGLVNDHLVSCFRYKTVAQR